MNSSPATDTYVICYSETANLWTAYSVKTRQVGGGTNPAEALTNAVENADRAMASDIVHSNACQTNSSHELMLTLAKIARPIRQGEYTPGVVYKYERTWSLVPPPV